MDKTNDITPNIEGNEPLGEAPNNVEVPTSAEMPITAEVPTVAETPIVTEAPAVAETTINMEAPTVAEAPEVTSTVENIEASAETETPVAIETQNATDAPKTEDATAAISTKKNKVPIIATLICSLLLVCGSAVALLLLNNNEEQKDNDHVKVEKPEVLEVSKLRMQGNSLSDFDLELLKQNNDGENIVYSPLSIKYALAMLSDGANGRTKEELDNIVGDYTPKAYLNSEHRSFANALFVREKESDKFLDSYLDSIESRYAAEVVSDPFDDFSNINKWISGKTLGIVNNFFNESEAPDSSTFFYLVNALAIDMDWNHRIQYAVTNNADDDTRGIYYSVNLKHEKYSDNVFRVEEDDFETIGFNNNTIEVPAAKIGATINNYDLIEDLGEDQIRAIVKEEFLKWLHEYDPYEKEYTEDDADDIVEKHIEGIRGNSEIEAKVSTDFEIYVDDDVKVFAKDLKKYDGSTLQYVGIMPKNVELEDYIKNTSAEEISEIIDSLYEIEPENFKDGVITRITGNIPFFKINSKFDLVDNLKQLGIEKVFDEKEADLSSMTTAESAYISEVKQKAEITFTNDGIRAAAVTVDFGEGGTGGGFYYAFEVPVETIDMTFDKPYLYVIRDKNTGEIWFVGAVYEPAEDVSQLR